MKLSYIAPITFLLLALAGCAKTDKNIIEPASGGQDDTDNAARQIIADKNLSINEYRCTGCGKCARIDSEHFSMDSAGRKAVVVSTDNLSSHNLTLAISICRDQAIEII